MAIKFVLITDERGNQLEKIDFGDTEAGKTKSKDVFIRNVGPGFLEDSKIVIGGEMSKYSTTPPIPEVIGPQESVESKIIISIPREQEVKKLTGTLKLTGTYRSERSK